MSLQFELFDDGESCGVIDWAYPQTDNERLLLGAGMWLTGSLRPGDFLSYRGEQLRGTYGFAMIKGTPTICFLLGNERLLYVLHATCSPQRQATAEWVPYEIRSIVSN